MKIRTCAALTAAATALIISCSTRSVQPILGEVVVDTLVSNGMLDCKVECSFATILNADDSPALTAIEQANIGYFFELEEFRGTARAAADSLLHEIKSAYLQDLEDQRSYEFSTGSEISVGDTLLTFAVNRWSYLGGAHGMYSRDFHTYSLADGYEYVLADLFSEAQLKELDRAIRIKLYEDYQADDDDALTKAGFFPEYIAPTENFIITADGMAFFYNPYEIGCYALGPVEVQFTAEEIAQLRR